jgi:hypothetical protein
MIATGFVLAAGAMYLFSRIYLNRAGSLLSAVMYTYAPYHSIDVYVRGALPEFWSFVFVPALFWSISMLSKTYAVRYVIFTGLFSAGLILTHNLMAMMSGIFLGIWALYLFITTDNKMKYSMQGICSILLGFGLSAYFWIPSFFEKKYTLIELLTQELADYNLHFVYIRQFFQSPWGYGGSLYGLYDGLSFELGIINIILTLLVGCASVIIFIKKKKIPWALSVFFVLLFISLFMQTFYSKPIWNFLPPFGYIQFPWRFLMFSAFTMSFIGGWIMNIIPHKKFQYGLLIILSGVIVVWSIPKFQPSAYLTTATDKSYTDPSVIQWRTSIMAFEYVPQGVATRKSEVGNTVIDITRDQVATSVATVVNGNIKIEELRDDPHYKEISIDAQTEGIVQFSTFDFPGWKTFLNEDQISYNSDNKFKLITLSIPKGQYIIKAVFTDTPLRLFSNIITIFTVVLLFVFLLYNKYRQGRSVKTNYGKKD